MTPASAKGKGRRLQQAVARMLLELHPTLTPDDVASAPSGTNGVDVRLSQAARKLFPYNVECKNRETFKTLYSMYEQACSHNKGKGEPLLIVSMNRQKPLAIVDAAHFIALAVRH